ncbi:hypothetical protein FZEAL_4984 [Fusarium zealandicum]|uniref:Uncharacterized protein n=1 Tax=Fusarium zealandicum TaxID=1053134 RepID=A0A8H4ULE9_9HYPO|nr:hypothetical protein FZEAL_4984 [Fusarium zealandicum]
MPCTLLFIHLIDVWPLSEGDGNWKCNAKSHYKPSNPLRAKACFQRQEDNGVISSKIIEGLLGPQRHRYSDCPPFVGISWSVSSSHHKLEVSHLQVVSGLKHDLIITNGCGQWSSLHQPRQSPSPLSFINSEFDKSIRGEPANDKMAEDSPEDIHIKDRLADHGYVRSLAASMGIILANPQSVDSFASLLRQIQHKTADSGMIADASILQPGSSAPSLTSGRTESSASASNSSIHGSRLDECGINYDWCMASSRKIPFVPFQEYRFSYSPEHVSAQHPGALELESQITPTISPGGSRTSLEREDDTVMEDEEEECVPEQSQPSDFMMHPGHKIWVWDIQRQRWRRRGRSGLEETDWFPESLA